MRQLIPLATAATTLTSMWLVGNRRAAGWAVGLAGQTLWFAFIVVFAAWGLLPLSVALTVIYARNLLRWRATPEMPVDDGATVGLAATGGRSGAPTGFPAEGNSGRRRAVGQGQVTSVGRLRGIGEAVMLTGHRNYSPVEKVARDGLGFVALTLVRPHGKITMYMRPDEPCRVLRAA